MPRLPRWTWAFLLVSLAVPEASAQECVASPTPVQIDFIVDGSPHMARACSDTRFGTRTCPWDDWKLQAAKLLALRILDGVTLGGPLGSAGGGQPPNGVYNPLPPPGLYYYPVSPASADSVHTWLQYLFVSPEDWYSSYPLFAELQTHAERLQALAGDRKVLIVIGHMGSWYDLSTADSARLALQALAAVGGRIFFFHVGPAVLDASAPELLDGKVSSLAAFRDLAASVPGATLRVVGRSSDLSGEVLAELSRCENHRPVVSLSVSPNPLRHGTDGQHNVVFDASGSHDAPGETPDDRLIYRWRLTQPDGSIPAHWRPVEHVGNPGAIIFNPRPFGTYNMHLDVDDGAGGVASIDRPFEVTGSAPSIRLQVEPPVSPIQSGVDLAVRTTVLDDLDNEEGGGLSFQWRIVGGPPAASARVATLPTDRSFVGWHTTVEDVSVLSDGTRVAPPWHFELTVRDDEGEMVGPDFVDVDVVNRAPLAQVSGDARRVVKQGAEIALSGTARDPDGAPLRSLYWDVVQAPDTAAGRGLPARGVAGWGPNPPGSLPPDETLPIELATGTDDAGTWIFQLVATDGSGETTRSAPVTVVVDAPPIVRMDTRPALASGVVEIGSVTGALDLDASRSFDPDSPCDSAHPCHSHTNLDGPPQNVTQGIQRFTWTLVDVPREFEAGYPRGGVTESLQVPGNLRTLHLDPHTLRPGEWTFELTIEDDESNENEPADPDPARVRVRVNDETHDPVAIASDPARFTLDPGGRSALPVEVSGVRSFDPDNLLTSTPRARGGIREYHWRAVGPCVVPEPGEMSPVFTLFPSDVAVPVECRGFWTITLTVVDFDEPAPRRATTATTLVIGTCPQAICIDYPRSTLPAVVERAEGADVPIYYHLDPSLYVDHPLVGLTAYLEIFDVSREISDARNARVYRAIDPALEESAFGPSLAFHWDGTHGLWDGEHDRSIYWPLQAGIYSVKISLIDPVSSTVVAQAYEPASIWIEANRRTRISVQRLDGALDHVDIARWDEAYRDDGSVRNLESPGFDDDFIYRDPARFYVRVDEPGANRSDMRETIQVQIGTLYADGSVHDPPHEITLFERPDAVTGRFTTGDFISVSQLLVMPSVLSMHNDDEFRASNGVGPVSDEAEEDRTHGASVDGFLFVRRAGPNPAVAQVPVCSRHPGDPDARLVGTVNFVIFNMPYIDTNRSGAYDPGEPFMYTDPAQPHWDFRSDLGTWGPVMPPERVQRLLDEANALWSPACISFERGRVEVRDFPLLDPDSDAGLVEPRQHGDQVMDQCDVLGSEVLPKDFFLDYLRSRPLGDYTVFVGTELVGCGGYAWHAAYWTHLLHPENATKPITILPLRVGENVLAHELGHILTNAGNGDVDTPLPVFFPETGNHTGPRYVDPERGPTNRTDVGLGRRFSLATQNAARTDRRQFHLVPGDITSPLPSDPNAPGNYLLRPVDR